jgi:signal transduction histidine kinase
MRAIDVSLRGLREEWMRHPETFEEAVQRHEGYLKKENVVQIALVGADGRLLYSRLPQPSGLNFADRDYFQRHKARGTDELDISRPILGRITRRLAVQVSRPLFDARGKFAGVIVVAVPSPGLEKMFEEVSLGADSIIALARADGVVLARAGSPSSSGATLAGSAGLGATAPIEGRFISATTPDGTPRMFSFRRSEDYPFTLFVGQSLSAVLAPYRAQRNSVLVGGAGATLLLGAVALLLVARAEERARNAAERERLMLELHDGCIQSIYAAGMTLEGSRGLVEKDPARAASALADAQASLNLVIQDLRAFISGEPTVPLTETQFMEEIERMIPQHGPRFTVEVDREVIPRLDAQAATHVLRIAREAVSNAVRHAGASAARLSLRRRGKGACLEVSDNGVGVATQRGAGGGLGLHHIEARARKLGGQMQIVAEPGGGTRIAVDFPLHA